MSEFEVFGEIQYANSYEKNYQKQYEYYANGSSKVKYNHTKLNSSDSYWLRSPSVYYGTNGYFCVVYGGGDIGHSYTNISYGFAPAFVV